MVIKYKQKCWKCKEKYVIATRRNQYLMCYECQKDDLKKPIDDPEMKKFFDIPPECYIDSAFLRSIKINYLKFGGLTEAQRKGFLKVTEEVKDDLKKPKEEPKIDDSLF